MTVRIRKASRARGPVEQAGERVHGMIVDARACFRAVDDGPSQRIRFSGGHDHHHHPLTVLVTGGTGKTGRRVADRLLPPAAPSASARARHPPFDWHDPATWPAAVDGVDAAYLAYAPDWRSPAPPRSSAPSPARRSTTASAGWCSCRAAARPGAGRAERLVQRGGRRVDDRAQRRVRPELHRGGFVERDRWCLALHVADVAEPFVDVDDIADIAAAALARRPPRRPAVRGDRAPAAHVRRGARRRSGAAIGRPSATCASRGEIVDGARRRRRAGRGRGDLVALFAKILDGRNSPLADGVRRALGRPAGDFRAVVRGGRGGVGIGRWRDARRSMASGFARLLTVACAIGAGLVAGVFFAFSTFVMQRPAAGPGVDRDVGHAVDQPGRPTPLFMVALLGTGLGCIVLVVVAFTSGATRARRGRWPASPPTSVAAAHDRLPRPAQRRPRPASTRGPGRRRAWRGTSTEWVPWNHVRTAASLSGAVVLTWP